jgi:hypothetical protein
LAFSCTAFDLRVIRAASKQNKHENQGLFGPRIENPLLLFYPTREKESVFSTFRVGHISRMVQKAGANGLAISGSKAVSIPVWAAGVLFPPCGKQGVTVPLPSQCMLECRE